MAFSGSSSEYSVNLINPDKVRRTIRPTLKSLVKGNISNKYIVDVIFLSNIFFQLKVKVTMMYLYLI